MFWESKVLNQMLCCLSSWMALLSLLLLFSTYLLLGFGFLSILYTSIVIFLSTTLLHIVSKHNAVLVDNDDDKLVEQKVLSSDQLETDAKEPQEEVSIDDGVTNYSTTSPDSLSESECQDRLSTTSEGSEVDWSTFGYDVDRSPDLEYYSDGSISDEESLIEIALPSGHYVDPQKDEPKKYKCSLQQKKRELSAEALFMSQQSLMELLSEFNEVSEEENLIEIDISMGSIKYSRFEIKA